MVPEVGRQVGQQAIDDGRAVSVEEVDEPECSLLRVSERKNLRLGARELTPQRLVPLLGRLNHLVAQPAQILFHSRQRRLCRAGERRIDSRHRFDHLLHAPPHRVFGLCDRLFHRLRNLRFEQPVERRFVLRLERFHRHVVTRQETRSRRIDQRRRGARVDERHRYAEAGVDLAQLSEVRELARPGDIADRRKERVLDQGPQQNVWTEQVR